MGKVAELKPCVRAQVMILLKEGYNQCEVARKMNVSRGAVQRCINRSDKLNSTSDFSSLKRSGRPRKTTPTTDHSIIRICKRSPKSSSSKIQAQLPTANQPSTRTIRRRLFEAGLKARKPARKPMLSLKNIRDRIAFCKKYRKWTEEQWENVMFSDESTFSQFYTFAPYIRRPVGKRYEAKYCIPSVKQASKIMIWACFSGKGGRGAIWFCKVGQTVGAEVYKQILEEKLLPFLKIQQVEYFQHDGAPCHQARSVKTFLQSSAVPVIGPWPGSSPDLNPIENLWQQMKIKVAARHPTSNASLEQSIKEVWIQETQQDMCRRLA